MKRQITRISLHQTAKIISLMVFVLISIFLIPAGILTLIGGETESALLLFVMPFVYLVVFYILLIIYGWIYNLLAPKLGGVEFEISDIDSTPDPR